MIQTVITIASVVAAIGTIIGALIKLYKVINKFEKTQENVVKKEDLEAITDLINGYIDSQKETSRCIIRHEITSTYYAYKDEKKLPEHVREDLSYLYSQYEKLEGNSYVKDLMTLMKSWNSVD